MSTITQLVAAFIFVFLCNFAVFSPNSANAAAVFSPRNRILSNLASFATIPTSCNDTCTAIQATINDCSDGVQCICTSANEGSLQNCVNCLEAVLPNNQTVITQAQDILDQYAATCDAGGISVAIPTASGFTGVLPTFTVINQSSLIAFSTISPASGSGSASAPPASAPPASASPASASPASASASSAASTSPPTTITTIGLPTTAASGPTTITAPGSTPTTTSPGSSTTVPTSAGIRVGASYTGILGIGVALLFSSLV